MCRAKAENLSSGRCLLSSSKYKHSHSYLTFTSFGPSFHVGPCVLIILSSFRHNARQDQYKYCQSHTGEGRENCSSKATPSRNPTESWAQFTISPWFIAQIAQTGQDDNNTACGAKNHEEIFGTSASNWSSCRAAPHH